MSSSETSRPDTGSRVCWHCGEPVPAGSRYLASIEGVSRTMCCPGCAAVAEAIAGAGLCAYYERRSAPGRTATVTEDAAALSAYDSPAFQQDVVRRMPDGSDEIVLLLDGVTCAACVWLIERRLQALEGVLDASVNFSTLRARVRWDPERVRLGAVIAAVRAIGYDAQPFEAARADARRREEGRQALWRLFVAAFGMMQVMMYAIPTYLADGDMAADIESLMHWASLLLTIPVVGFSARPFFAGALRDLRARTVGMDVPVALGIAVAFAGSVHATLTGRGQVYFDSVTMFVFLLLAARWLESAVRARAGRSLDRLSRLVPAFAMRLTAGPGAEGEHAARVAVADLVPGDRVLVGTGEIVPADGVMAEGDTEVDESLLTGESLPVPKRPGDPLTGGSLNVASRLVLRVERVGRDTAVAGIVRLLERAGADKPAIARVADRIAAAFVAAVIVLACGAALAWSLVDPDRALPIAVTVLVITCPCALSLATPAALAAATGSLTRLGVLITRGHALETLARATHFVFDKTGTLTTGRLSLVGVMPVRDHDRAACLALAAVLERDARHPVGRALVEAAGREVGDSGLPAAADVRDVPGRGVEATVGGRRVRIGRADFVAALHGQAEPGELSFVADHVQAVALGDEGGWIAVFTLSDTIRPEARALVRRLQADGRVVALLTGDRLAVAGHVARELGIAVVEAGVPPEGKVAFVRELQRAGATVAMVGDGVNDAPVLAQAQVSVSLGSGADLAKVHADVVLAAGGLARLHDVLTTAVGTRRVIVQNLAWALAYNAVAVPAAALGMIGPLLASIGMAASSAGVVANALRAAHPALWRPEDTSGADGRQRSGGVSAAAGPARVLRGA